MRERYQALESEAKNQKARADQLERQLATNEAAVAEIGELRRQGSELNAENKSLAQRASIFEGAANEAQAELNRLRAAYERPAEVAARYKEIEMPHISVDKVKQPVQHEIDELTWLTGIGNACDTYGLHFNPRILKAFIQRSKQLNGRRSLSWRGFWNRKIRTPAPLLALWRHLFRAAVCPTELGFAGIHAGFFNSIDNKFDAQPVLRFRAKSDIRPRTI